MRPEIRKAGVAHLAQSARFFSGGRGAQKGAGRRSPSLRGGDGCDFGHFHRERRNFLWTPAMRLQPCSTELRQPKRAV